MIRKSTCWPVLATVVFAFGTASAFAQDAPPPPPPPPGAASPDFGAPPPPPPGAPGGGFGGGAGRRGGGRRGLGGQVTDVSANGFTFQTRNGQTVTVTTTSNTQYTVTNDSPLSSLKTGQTVMVMGPADASSNTVQAFRIMSGAMPQFGGGNRPGGQGGPGGPGGPGGFGGGRFVTNGKVVSTSPLKVKSTDGTVYTVETQPGATVSTFSTGTSHDLAVGKYVMVQPENPPAAGGQGAPAPIPSSVTARRVTISTTPPQFGGGRRNGGGGGGGAPNVQ